MAQAPKSVQQVLQELWELLKAYAQQETLGPIKNLGKQVGFGLVGTLSFALGYFLIVLGVMRFLQTHSPEWWRPHNYLNYLVAVLMLGGACAWTALKFRHLADHDRDSRGAGSKPTDRDVRDLNEIVVIGEESRA